MSGGSRSASNRSSTGSRAANRMASTIRACSAAAGEMGLSAIADVVLRILSLRIRRPRPQEDGSVGPILPEVELPFLRELAAGRQAGGADRRSRTRTVEIVAEETVERGPVRRRTKNALENLARLRERPDRPPRHPHTGENVSLPLLGVGRQ